MTANAMIDRDDLTLIDAVRAILHRLIPDAVVLGDGDNIIASGLVDSAGLIGFLLEVERCLGVPLLDRSNVELERLLTVEGIAGLVAHGHADAT